MPTSKQSYGLGRFSRRLVNEYKFKPEINNRTTVRKSSGKVYWNTAAAYENARVINHITKYIKFSVTNWLQKKKTIIMQPRR